MRDPANATKFRISNFAFRNPLSVLNFLAVRHLTRGQKGFHQFTFTADRHSWEAMKPPLLRNLGPCVQPVRQSPQLAGGNLPLLDPVQQVLQQGGR